MSTYDIQIAEVSPVERDIKVTIPEAEIKERMSAVFERLAAEANIPGFRPGKAPRKVVEQIYRKQVWKDVEADILSEGYRQAVESNKLHPLAMPSFRKAEYKGAGDYIFSFMLEIRPEIKEVKLDGFKVERPKVRVTDDMVDEELQNLREQNGVMKSVSGRDIVADGDWVNLDYEGFLDGTPFPEGKAEKQLVHLGDKRFIPGFEEAIVGKKKGERFSFEVNFPEDFRDERFKSKPVRFDCLVHDIQERELPALDDQFAKDLGTHEDLAALRRETRKKIEEFFQSMARREFRNNLWRAIVEANPLPLPSSFLKEQTRRVMEREVERLKRSGMNPAALGMDEAAFAERSQKQATFDITAALIQMRLAELHNITVTQEDEDAEFAKMAAQFGVPVENLKAYYNEKEEMRDELTMTVQQEKLELLLEDKVTVVEVDPPKPEDEAGKLIV